MKSATYFDVGRLIHLAWRTQLFDPAVAHQGDAVGHGERFFLVVGHVDEGDAELAVELLELELHLLSQLQVECAQRFVEQQHPRAVHERPRERHPLLLSAGELPRAPLCEVAELHHVERLGDPGRPISPWRHLRIRSPYSTFSRTLMWGNSAYCWNTVLKSRLKGGSGVIGTPSIRISPEVGCSNPAIMRRVVVLPEPLAPRKVRNSPGGDVERHVVDGGEGVEALGEVLE